VKVEGEMRVRAPIDEVWDILMDPDRLGRILPGCEQLRQIDAAHFEVLLAVKVQFMTMRARAMCELLETVKPSRLVASMLGETTSLAGGFRTTLAIDLQEEVPVTRVRYELDATLLGRLATLGQPIVRATTRRLADEFADNLAEVVQATNTQA
jgi:uncharacterized protein